MTKTLTLNQYTDIPNAVVTVLGFEPEDSLAVLALGIGPSCRADLIDTPHEAVVALEPAVPQWTAVLVAIYTQTHVLAVWTVEEIVNTYPWLDIRDAVRIYDGRIYRLSDPNDPGREYERKEAKSRTALVAKTQEVTDADEAARLAREAYLKGNGALAWCYLDQHEVLNHGYSEQAESLAHLLNNAVDPKSQEV